MLCVLAVPRAHGRDWHRRSHSEDSRTTQNGVHSDTDSDARTDAGGDAGGKGSVGNWRRGEGKTEDGSRLQHRSEVEWGVVVHTAIKWEAGASS